MGIEQRPPAEHGGRRWSITDGHFVTSYGFPVKSQIEGMRHTAEGLDESIRHKILYRALLKYAFRAVNPAVFENTPTAQAIDEELDYAAAKCVERGKKYVEDDLQKITPEILPKEVPVMQALKVMHDVEAISRDERVIMDGAVREIFLRQQKPTD